MNTILNTIAFGGLLKYPRKPNLIIGELVKEYNPGDILDANATVQTISYYMQNLPYDNIREEFIAYRTNSELHFQAIDQAVRALQQQSGSDFTDLQEKVAILTERVKTINSQLQSIDLSGMRTDINQLKADTLQNSTNIATLKNEVDYIKTHGSTSSELTALIAWKNSITQADTDNVINKWSEVVKFLAGISSTTDLAHILVGKQNKLTAGTGINLTDAAISANMYTTTGDGVDGSMTQKAITDAVNSAKQHAATQLTTKQDKLTAGNGITITNNKIDCTIPKVTVDSDINATSVNPVQNKVISAALDTKQNKLTAGAGITIEDNGTIKATGTSVVIDTALSPTSTNPVQNKVINAALETKQNKLIAGSGITIEANGTIKATGTSVVIDNVLNESSTNPVQNKVIAENFKTLTQRITTAESNINTKQPKLTAGTGIQISPTNVITATATPITVATVITETETNPASGKAVYDFANPIKVQSAQNNAEITQIKTNKQNKLTPGPGINIVGDIISATGTSVTVDNTITPTGANPVSGKAVNDFVTPIKTEIISVKTTKQDKLTAGSGINIVGNIISATGTSVTIDNVVTPTGANPVSGKAVTDYAAPIKTEITQLKSGKQDKMIAGSGITITGNSVAAKMYTTIGTAVDGSMTQKAVTDSISAKADKTYVDNKLNTKQDKLIAGANITIIGNTISAANSGTVTIDSIVTSNGANAVSGKAVYDYVEPVKTSITTTLSQSKKYTDIKTENKQDKLIVGDHIKIENNKISAVVDPSLSSSSTNPVENRVVFKSINTKQDTLIAGANITIVGNTISSTGGSVTVDQLLDPASDNAVSSKAAAKYINNELSSYRRTVVHQLSKITGQSNMFSYEHNIIQDGAHIIYNDHLFILNYDDVQYSIRTCGKMVTGIYYTDVFCYDGNLCYGYINDDNKTFKIVKLAITL